MLKRSRLLIAAIVVALGLPASAQADSVKEMLPKLPPPSLESQKTMADLEYCISVGASEWFSPVAIRGEGKLLIYGSMNASFMSGIAYLVAIEDKGERRTIAVKVYKGYDARMNTLLRSCI